MKDLGIIAGSSFAYGFLKAVEFLGEVLGEKLKDFRDKWLIDPVDFADKMTMIYKDKKLREKFSKNGLKFSADYDWETKIVPQWIDLFKYSENFVEKLDYGRNKPGI